MPDKTVSIVNGVLRVNGMERGQIVKNPFGGWKLDLDLCCHLSLTYPEKRTWPTRKAAAEWVKEKLADR